MQRPTACASVPHCYVIHYRAYAKLNCACASHTKISRRDQTTTIALTESQLTCFLDICGQSFAPHIGVRPAQHSRSLAVTTKMANRKHLLK